MPDVKVVGNVSRVKVVGAVAPVKLRAQITVLKVEGDKFLGGYKLTVSVDPPPDPQVGDLWLDIS